METVKEKIAYLRGMIDGDESIKDEKAKTVLVKMMQVLDDIADDVDELMIDQEEIGDYIEAIDSDLADLEDDFYDEEDEDDELEMVEMECPNCQEMVCFEESFLYDEDVEVSCPDCGAIVFDGAELDEDDHECCHGHDHDHEK